MYAIFAELIKIISPVSLIATLVKLIKLNNQQFWAHCLEDFCNAGGGLKMKMCLPEVEGKKKKRRSGNYHRGKWADQRWWRMMGRSTIWRLCTENRERHFDPSGPSTRGLLSPRTSRSHCRRRLCASCRRVPWRAIQTQRSSLPLAELDLSSECKTNYSVYWSSDSAANEQHAFVVCLGYMRLAFMFQGKGNHKISYDKCWPITKIDL